jgi:tRNA (guanine26-N2/guanine27-N2)-dimethyltransferase
VFNSRNQVPERCTTCGGSLRLGGPIWSEKIHQSDFVNRLYHKSKEESCALKTKGRISGTLGGIIDEEILADQPLNYSFVNVCSELKLINPTKEQIIAGFRSLNYMLCQTYYNSYLWKTNAPPSVIYEIFKQFKLQTYGKDDIFKNLKEGTVGHTVLSKPTPEGLEVNFNVD